MSVPVKKKSIRFRAITILIAGFILGLATVLLCLSRSEKGWAFSAALLMIVTFFWFFLGEGLVIAERKARDGGPPPIIFIVTAIVLEIAKVFFLSRLPVSGGTLSAPVSIWLSNAALGCAFATALTTFGLASAVGLSLDARKTKDWVPFLARILSYVALLVEWLQRKRVAALCITFASFLLVTYFLAFAVGFDDRNEVEPALYSPVTAAGATRASIEAALQGMTLSVEATDPKINAATPPASGDEDHMKFAFAEGTANIEDTLAVWPAIQTECVKGGNARGVVEQWATDGGAVAEKLRREPHHVVLRNLEALCKSMRWFESAAREGLRQRILIFGHANKAKFDAERIATDDRRPPYRSNAELAGARAQLVFLALNQIVVAAEKRNGRNVCDLLQWQIASGASETSMLLGGPQNTDSWIWGGTSDPQISVEVQREILPTVPTKSPKLTLNVIPPPSTLVATEGPKSRGQRRELLDYVYFMIYTITTTGYGDLMPVTPRTKFIVSVANLFEVTYLAMIFMLISTKRDRCVECDRRHRRPEALTPKANSGVPS